MDLLLQSLIVWQRKIDVKHLAQPTFVGAVIGAGTKHGVAEGYKCKRDGDRGWGWNVGKFTRWMTGAWNGGSADEVDDRRTFQETEQ